MTIINISPMVFIIDILKWLYNILLTHNLSNQSPIVAMLYQVLRGEGANKDKL